MKLKRINSKLNTKLEDICKNLKSTLPKLIQDYRDESPGWGCFVMASSKCKEYTFVHGDSENSESIDPEFGISYFIVKQYPQGDSKLTEFGVAPKNNAENHLTSFKFVKDDNDQWVEHYCYGKYCGPDKSLWQKELVQAYSTGKLLPVIGTVPPGFTGIVEYTSGTKVWYLNGKYHRVDGPAIEYPDGGKDWFLIGQRHREDGPAREYDGRKEWWLNGVHCTETEWEKLVNGESLTSSGVTVATEAKVSKVEPIKVKASSEIPKGFTGIAEHPNGSKLWYLNGKLHREDGPAVEWADGRKEWWLNGKQYSETEWEKLVKGESLTSASAGVTVATEAKVSKKVESFKDIVVSDSKMVTRRIAVEKIAKLVQGLLTQAFTSNVKGKNKKLMQTQLGEFFSTENGKAIIKFVMGCVAPFIKSHVPEKYHGVIDDVATEARVQGETTAILQAVEMIQPMISMLSSSVMQSLETLVAVDEKVRVHVEMDSPEVYHETVAVAPNVAATA
jgi:hypothetical protein